VIPFILPIIGLSILQILVIGGPGVILMLIHPGLLVLYIFPAFYFFLGFILSAQALIVEREGVIDAMKRSFFLTRGKKLEIFGYMILVGIFNFIIQKGMENVIAPIIIRMIDPVSVRIFVYLSIYYLSQAFTTGIMSCIYILIYFNQRIVKEGFDLEHLVDQFDSSKPLQKDVQ
jgi:hypothetical protein